MIAELGLCVNLLFQESFNMLYSNVHLKVLKSKEYPQPFLKRNIQSNKMPLHSSKFPLDSKNKPRRIFFFANFHNIPLLVSILSKADPQRLSKSKVPRIRLYLPETHSYVLSFSNKFLQIMKENIIEHLRPLPDRLRAVVSRPTLRKERDFSQSICHTASEETRTLPDRDNKPLARHLR